MNLLQPLGVIFFSEILRHQTVFSINITYRGDPGKLTVFSSEPKEWIISSHTKHQFFCKSDVLVRWRSTGQLASSWIEATQEWNHKKNVFLANLHLITTESATGYLICEPVEQKYSKLNVSDAVYLFVKGQESFVQNFGHIVLPFNSINQNDSCYDTHVPCRVTNPLIPIPTLTGITLDDSQHEITNVEYSRNVGFIMDSCSISKYSEISCIANNHSATYNITAQTQFTIQPNKEVVYPLRNVPFKLECCGDHNVTLISTPNNLSLEVEIIKKNDTTCMRMLLNPMEYDSSLKCQDSKNSHEWIIKGTYLPQSVQKRVDDGFRRYDPIRDVYECHNLNPNLNVRNLFCENHNDCELKKYCFEHGVCNNYIKTGVSCLDPNCQKIDYPFRQGLFECKSSTAVVRDMYFTGLDRVLYFTSRNIPTEAMINILEVKVPFYYGLDESLTIVCEYSLFLLVKGVRISVKYENGDTVAIHSTVDKKKKEKLLPRVSRNVDLLARSLTPTLNMTEVICEGQHQDGSGWVTSRRILSIIEAKPPKIINTVFNKTFLVGDPGPFYINCEVEGIPKPKVEWRKLNELDLNETQPFEVDGSILKFHYALLNISGEYECIAYNEQYNLSDSKTFYIHLETKPNTYIVYTFTGLIVFLLLGSLFLLLQYKNQVNNLNKYIKTLSEKEVNEFFEGLKTDFRCRAGTIDAVENALKMPYNDVYEVDPSSFVYESDSIIGKGTFGIVYKAIKQPSGRAVAVKTVKEEVDISAFKTILSEIKILIYLGFHPNIVEFVGAVTKDIQKLQVKVLLEYCSNGDLQMYLRKMAKQPDEYINSITVTQTQFIKWCTQIAYGLEHLAKRRIIHGDLATRNVLLDENLVAKISDFGLSTKSIDYSVYVTKGKEAPLPWRWMAIESLTMYNFSTSSDIWSFGVTMWEIFSLGAVPYPSQTWDEIFVELLRNGNRLLKPKDCKDEIYQIMQQCWIEDYRKRPSITTIRESLESVLNSTANLYTRFTLGDKKSSIKSTDLPVTRHSSFVSSS